MVQPVLFVNIDGFNGAQLIVGPSKFNTNHLRQTDGERFFDFCKEREFSSEFERPSKLIVTIKTQNLTSTYV
jgi:hypothetical protein